MNRDKRQPTYELRKTENTNNNHNVNQYISLYYSFFQTDIQYIKLYFITVPYVCLDLKLSWSFLFDWNERSGIGVREIWRHIQYEFLKLKDGTFRRRSLVRFKVHPIGVVHYEYFRTDAIWNLSVGVMCPFQKLVYRLYNRSCCTNHMCRQVGCCYQMSTSRTCFGGNFKNYCIKTRL